MANLSDLGIGQFITDILTGLGNGLIALVPALVVLGVGSAIAVGIGYMFKRIFVKAF